MDWLYTKYESDLFIAFWQSAPASMEMTFVQFVNDFKLQVSVCANTSLCVQHQVLVRKKAAQWSPGFYYDNNKKERARNRTAAPVMVIIKHTSLPASPVQHTHRLYLCLAENWSGSIQKQSQPLLKGECPGKRQKYAKFCAGSKYGEKRLSSERKRKKKPHRQKENVCSMTAMKNG